MRKLPTGFGLGPDLRSARKSSGRTQAGLAVEVGLSEKTVRMLEQGIGNLDSWGAVLQTLGLEVAGRNLPSGDSLGEKLASLRKARGLNQRELAAMVGVTQPTIVTLERRLQGRLTTLESVLAALGAGAYLAKRGQAKAFYTHAGNASTNHAWETPRELLQLLTGVFGRFDLDPCSPRKSRSRVPSWTRWTEDDDGLSLTWFGTVFMNPPYGRGLAAWIEKAHGEVRSGNARAIVALLPARPDTNYWHQHIAKHAAVYFLKGRLKFGDGKQSAPFPSALVVWGAEQARLASLEASLPDAWRTG